MDERMILCVLCFLLWQYHFSVGDHIKPEGNDPDAERRTKVNVNVPNFLNLFPNFGKLMEEMEKDVFNPRSVPEVPVKSESAVPDIHRVKDNYKTLREFVQSAIKATTRGVSNVDNLFSLNVQNKGPNTKVDLDSIFGRMSMKAKSREKVQEDIGTTPETEQTSTEVPLTQYLSNLIEEQAKRIEDFSLSIEDRKQNPIVSVKSTDKKATVDVASPILPVKVSVDSTQNIKRSGYMPLGEEAALGESEDEISQDSEIEEPDPEEDYLEHVQKLHRKRMQLRGYDASSLYSNENERQEESYDPIINVLKTSKFKPLASKNQESMLNMQRDPIKKMTEYYYNLSTGKFQEKPHEDNDAFEEYIEDLEQVTGTLSTDSKDKLRKAFRQFKDSLDKVEFGDKVDMDKLINEPVDVHAWVPGRMIDQRDLEIAFLNIDKDEKPDPGDRMVLAFTLTGMPLKLYMDPEIENPIQYLHKRLTEAGVTLHIPVSSFNDMEPVSGEILYVGAGNQAKTITRAMSVIVPKTDSIRRYVKPFSKQDVGKEDPRETLTSALQESLSMDKKLKFSETLAENLKKNPDQVLDDLMEFLEQSSVSKARVPTNNL